MAFKESSGAIHSSNRNKRLREGKAIIVKMIIGTKVYRNSKLLSSLNLRLKYMRRSVKIRPSHHITNPKTHIINIITK